VSPGRAEKPLAISIRRARAADGPALRALFSEVDELHARLLPTFFRTAGDAPARPALRMQGALRGRDAVMLVAEADGETVGLVHVELFDTPPVPIMVPCRRGHVEDLIVLLKARRRGVGRRLLDAAATWARDRGAMQLLLTVWEGNVAAERFYRALGYDEVSHVLKRDL
jgi:GNAT superfamily N-acetyltransferase